MGKSSNGPDMMDNLMYLAQMDKQGGWFTSVLMLPDGSVNAPHVTFSLLSSKRSQPKFGEPGTLTVYDGYPSKEHRTFNGAFYRALIEHDRTLSQLLFMDGLT